MGTAVGVHHENRCVHALRAVQATDSDFQRKGHFIVFVGGVNDKVAVDDGHIIILVHIQLDIGRINAEIGRKYL